MLTLFPGERPEYPEDGLHSLDRDNAAVFSLAVEGADARLTAEVFRGGQSARWGERLPRRRPGPGPGEGLSRGPARPEDGLLPGRVCPAGPGAPLGGPYRGAPGEAAHPGHARRGHPGGGQRELERDYHVSPVRAALAMDCAQASLAARQQLGEKQVSLYIGIPFCPTRCAYCSFVSADVGRTLKLVDPYLEAAAGGGRRHRPALQEAAADSAHLLHGGRHPHHPVR